jgi:hypothetical protein
VSLVTWWFILLGPPRGGRGKTPRKLPSCQWTGPDFRLFPSPSPLDFGELPPSLTSASSVEPSLRVEDSRAGEGRPATSSVESGEGLFKSARQSRRGSFLPGILPYQEKDPHPAGDLFFVPAGEKIPTGNRLSGGRTAPRPSRIKTRGVHPSGKWTGPDFYLGSEPQRGRDT